MQESKTIEIDEIVTPGKAPGADGSSRSGPASGAEGPPFQSGDPFSDFQKKLPWKARLTLKATQWFMTLRSKSWGKLVIVPAVILALILVIPVGMLLFCLLLIRSFFKSLSR